jgi:type II secretory pathway component HofQ
MARFNTKEILRILATEGTPSSEATIRRVRYYLSVKLRLTPKQREEQLRDLELILLYKETIGESEDFGRRARYRYIRAIGLYYTKYSLCPLIYHPITN